MSGGSLCKVGVVEFPAGINYKLLFVIITMLNTINDTSMPAENCTVQNRPTRQNVVVVAEMGEFLCINRPLEAVWGC